MQDKEPGELDDVVELIPASGRPWWHLAVLGLAVIVVIALLVVGLLALRRMMRGQGDHSITEVVEVPLEGGMEVVGVLLEQPLDVEDATLFLGSGDRVGSTVLPGERRVVLFFVSAGERWERVEVETPAGIVTELRR